MSADKSEIDFLKYLEPEYKNHLISLDLSDVVTLERKMRNALIAIQNDCKDGG